MDELGQCKEVHAVLFPIFSEEHEGAMLIEGKEVLTLRLEERGTQKHVRNEREGFEDGHVLPSCLLISNEFECSPFWGNSRFSVLPGEYHGVARAARNNLSKQKNNMNFVLRVPNVHACGFGCECKSHPSTCHVRVREHADVAFLDGSGRPRADPTWQFTVPASFWRRHSVAVQVSEHLADARKTTRGAHSDHRFGNRASSHRAGRHVKAWRCSSLTLDFLLEVS